MKAILKALVILVSFLLSTPAVVYAAWPERPITLIVPYPAGGGTDVIGRLIAKELATRLSANIVVENRSGASGNIGARAAAKASPDGYTLFLATTAQSINMAIYADPGYELVESFEPIYLVNTGPMVMLSQASAPYSNVLDFLQHARKSQEDIRYATAGNGTSSHMTAEVFSHLTGAKMLHIPYTGAAPALNGLLGGQVDVVFDALMTTYPYVQSGKLKALGVTTLTRSNAAPEVPTIAEQGVPALAKFNETLWNALMAPRGTDPKIVAAINSALRDSLQSQQVKQRMREMGNQPQWTSAEEARKFISSDVAQWKLRAKDMKLSIN